MKHDLAEVVLTCRALSAQYGVDVFPTGKEAYTTVDSRGRYVIGVPFVPDMGDGEWAMLRGYIDHECGHVKYTDMAGSDAGLDDVLRKYFVGTSTVRPEEHYFMEQQLKPWVHTVWNIFEDIRVEHLMGLDFPGCKYNFKKLVAEVFNENNAIDSLAEIYNSHLASILRDAMTLYLLYSVRSVVVPGLLPAKDALCKELCGGTRYKGPPIDMAVYGRDIDALARMYAVDPRDSLGATYQFMLLIHALMSAYGNDSDSASIRAYTDSLGALDTRVAGKSKSDQDDTIRRARGNNTAGVGRSTDVSGMTKHEMSSRALQSGKKGRRAPAGELSSALQELQSFRAYDSMDEFQAGSREDGLSAFMQEARRSIELQPDMVSSMDSIASSAGGRLAAVLQSETYQRCRTGWSGRLDGRRLHKTGVGDGRVFSRRAERKALHTEVIILYDASGSMQCVTAGAKWNNAGYAAVASYGLLKALRNIPHVRSAVWVFQNTACVPVAKFDMPVPGKYLHPYGSTPLGASVFRLLGEYTAQPDWRKILLIMSDGMPDSKELFRSALTAAKRSGVETYGIGIRTDAMNFFFPEECRLELYDLSKLVPGMFTMMQQAMLKGVRHA